MMETDGDCCKRNLVRDRRQRKRGEGVGRTREQEREKREERGEKEGEGDRAGSLISRNVSLAYHASYQLFLFLLPLSCRLPMATFPFLLLVSSQALRSLSPGRVSSVLSL